MIKFPKLHIATSVVNRILNVADGVEAKRLTMSEPPAAPDPQSLAVRGAALDFALMKPTPGELPPIDAAPEVATGKPLLDTMIEQR